MNTFFVAVSGGQKSGNYETVEDAHKWAQEHLKKTNATEAYILQAIGVFKRREPPIEYNHLELTGQNLTDEVYRTKIKF